MKAGMVFVTIILSVDAFFGSYFYGLHSRSVDVEDPSMKAYQAPVAETKPQPTKEEAPKKEKKSEKKSTKSSSKSKSPGKKKKH